MNIYFYESIILNIILLVIPSSTSCSIFPSLNCSCFQSDLDLNFPSSIKTYSHLHCKGNSLTKKTFQSPFGSDFQNQTRFRTISIEFLLKKYVEIHSKQFDSLAMLFAQTDVNAQIEISLRFNGFTHMKFHQQSLTSNIFQRKHQNKRLWLHLLPTTSNDIQMQAGEDNSTSLDDQFQFSDNCFSGLAVSQLNLYIYTLRDRFSSTSSFEHIFNNTNIGDLHFYGSMIPPGPANLRRTFKGLVRSLTLHRHVDTIDSNTFPYYFPVYSFNIHSIEAHSMDLDSFIPLYNNLRGLELIKPRFDVSINRLIPTLDSLSLDIEYLNERTLLGARHIHNLKLGSGLRRIHPQVLYNLPNRLRHFDLSSVDLSGMTPDSRCYLIDFLHKNSRNQLNVILPQIETLTECDCARLILYDIELNKKFKNNLSTDQFCSKQCRFSDCPIISEYFRDKYPLFTDHNRFINVQNETNDDLPSVDLFADPIDLDMIRFLINQPINTNLKQSTSTSFPNLVTVNFPDSINQDERKSKLTKSSLWIGFSIGFILVLVVLFLIVSIVLCILRYRKQTHFKPIPVYV